MLLLYLKLMENNLIIIENIWIKIDDNLVTLGLSEDALEDVVEIQRVNLPSEDQELSKDELCGDVEADDGSINIYSPIKGIVLESNKDVVENPNLIFEDCLGEGWLLKIEPTNIEDLDLLSEGLDLNDQDD